MKKRFFIRYNDAQDVFIYRTFTLLDADLIIKTSKADGTVILDQIYSIGSFSKNEVDAFSRAAAAKKEELLIEIPESEIGNINPDLLITCSFIRNNSYYEESVKFTEREFSLIDFGAYPHMVKDKVPLSKFNVVVMLPSTIEKGKMFVTDKSSVIALGESSAARRSALARTELGSDLYILTSDATLIDEYRTWLTEVKEVRKGVYEISSKNYFIMRPFTKEESANFTKDDAKALNHLLARASSVYTSSNPAGIYYDNVKPTLKDGWLIRREDLEMYMDEGPSSIPFADHFEVFRQTATGMEIISLDDALDIPRTVIKKGATGGFNLPEARKMHLFYEYDPTMPIPECLRGCYPVEFSNVDMTDDGLPVWEESVKIIQHQYNHEYAETLARKGIRSFIKITGPREMEIIKELEATGLLFEFEVYNYPNNNQKRPKTYYVARPYEVEHNQEFGTK